MAIDYQAISAVRSMQAEVDRYLASLEHDMAHMWGVAWGEISSEFTLAAYDLIDLGDGAWPSRRQILRSQRAANAMKVATDAIQDLTRNAAGRTIGNLQTVVDSAERWQRNIITAQLPSPDFLDWARVDSGAIDSIVRRATQRIESVLRLLPADVQAKMKATLIRGVAVGDNPNAAASQMVRKAGDAFAGGLRRARNIARTEMLDAHRASATASRKANSDVLQGWRWLCSLSRRTCPSCLAQNGSLHGVDEPGPLDHQSGRCTAVPAVKGWRDLGIGLDEPPDTFPDAQEWFARQDRATQVHIMGPERLKRLDNGTLSWGQLSARVETPGWRASYRVTPLGGTGSPIAPQLPKSPPSPTDPFAGLKRKAGESDALADAAATNPNFRQGREYQVNCTSCVTTNEMRRRGFDVEALPLSDGRVGRNAKEFLTPKWTGPGRHNPTKTEPLEFNHVGGIRNLESHVRDWPEGARGFVQVGWTRGRGGHVFSVEKIDGKARFFDPQSGLDDAVMRAKFKQVKQGYVWVVRVDDATPNSGVLEYIKEKG